MNHPSGISRTLFVLMAAACLWVTQTPGAVADTAAFPDQQNDAPPNTDIERVRVANKQRIIVNVLFDNLRRNSGGLSVYYDTRGTDPGPEYLATGGLFPGTDFQMSRIERWNDRTPELLIGCDLKLRVNYAKDKATFDVARGCVESAGEPQRVRVAAKSTSQDNSERDWAPQRRRFYDWVQR